MAKALISVHGQKENTFNPRSRNHGQFLTVSSTMDNSSTNVSKWLLLQTVHNHLCDLSNVKETDLGDRM